MSNDIHVRRNEDMRASLLCASMLERQVGTETETKTEKDRESKRLPILWAARYIGISTAKGPSRVLPRKIIQRTLFCVHRSANTMDTLIESFLDQFDRMVSAITLTIVVMLAQTNADMLSLAGVLGAPHPCVASSSEVQRQGVADSVVQVRIQMHRKRKLSVYADDVRWYQC